MSATRNTCIPQLETLVYHNDFSSVVRAFCLGYFSHFVSGLKPKYIGRDQKVHILASVVLNRCHIHRFLPRP